MTFSSWLRSWVLNRNSRQPAHNSGRRRGALPFRQRPIVEALEERVVPSASLVKDINPGPDSSLIREMVQVGNEVFITVDDGTYGVELWKSDGTTSGTTLVKDIWTGPNSGFPENLTNVNGTLFFEANDGTNGRELWKSDGTVAGTVMVKNINPGSGSSSPSSLTNVNGTLFFSAFDGSQLELWKSDGTEVGTVLVKDINPGGSSSSPSSLANVNGTLYFAARGSSSSGIELWKSDGTDPGTVMVKDINPGSGNSFPDDITNVNGTVFFRAADDTNGTELWKSDGTEPGTLMVKDINPGSANSLPSKLTNVNGILFFGANDGTSGREMWKSDGTLVGTTRVKDIWPGPSSGFEPQALTNVNGTLFFDASDGSNASGELWKSDGTETGTILVKDIGVGGAGGPRDLTNVNGTLFFSVDDHSVNGRELWKSDGTTAGTVLAGDIHAGSNSSSPEKLINVNGTIFFMADDGVHGKELWKFVDVVTPTNLEDVISSLPAGTTEVSVSSDPATIDQWLDAVADLPVNTGDNVDIIIVLDIGAYGLGRDVDVPAGYTLILDGANGQRVIEGSSPALTLNSGDMIVRNGVTFTNTTDAATILVKGGHLTLRDNIIEETSGGDQAAIKITGGTVDLGSTADPGGNTLDIKGAGEFIHHAGANPVSAIGNTFKIDGTTLTSNFDIEDEIFHALDAGGGGLVTYLGGNVYVTADSGSIQRGVDAVTTGGTVHVESSSFANYTAGSKLVTVAFANGPTLTQALDAVDNTQRTLDVTGTSSADTIKFKNGSNAGQIDVNINGYPVATFQPTGRLIAHGGEGDDTLELAGDVALPGWLYGDAGADRLKGGASNDVLDGGTDDDLLVGKHGRDFLLGGAGADRIVGNADDDILIAGTLNFTDQTAALAAIMAEWTSSRTYQQRIENITGVTTGSTYANRENGSYFLIVGDTVNLSDNAKDKLTGSAGDDWFFFDANGDDDRATDLNDEAFANDLTWINA